MITLTVKKHSEIRWKRRVLAYHERLNEFFDQLPYAMQTLIEDIQTGGAEIVTYLVEDGTFKVTIRIHNGLVLLLCYKLTSMPIIKKRTNSWSQELKWVYDEVDNKNGFRHSILLSGNWLLKIPFSDFKIKRLDNVNPQTNQRRISEASIQAG